MNETRQDYTASCPTCGNDAIFTTVGRPDYVTDLTDDGKPKVVDRIEVACDHCD